MTEDELKIITRRVRTRLHGNADLFDDPRSYVDGVDDALDGVERFVTARYGRDDTEAALVRSRADTLTRTRS